LAGIREDVETESGQTML